MNPFRFKAFRDLFSLFLAFGTLIFTPADTLDYGQAWLFLVVYFAASLAVILYLMKYNPALLERRMRGGPVAEKRKAQKIIMLFLSAGFIGLLVVPGLDHRYGWSSMAFSVSVIGDGLVLLGWLVIFFVFKANSFAASTVQIAPNQKVISTGPYAIVRHPMYVGGLALLTGIPIALGSFFGLLSLAAIFPALIWRILDEEKFLISDLSGYAEYKQKVRYRLVPGIF